MWLKALLPMSKVLVFEGNSYVCWKNEDIRLFYDCISKVLVFEGNRLRMLMVKNVIKECLKSFSYFKSFSFRG